jgi:hypothetical protein
MMRIRIRMWRIGSGWVVDLRIVKKGRHEGYV